MAVGELGIKKCEVAGMLLYRCWLISLGPGFYNIVEVARVDEDVRVLLDDLI
jgi:hypothetical protein